MYDFDFTAAIGISFQFGLKNIAILGTRTILDLKLGLFCRGSALIKRDSERWTQFRMSTFPELHMVRK